MSPPITITAKALRACVLVAARKGVSAEALLGPLGVDPRELEDADAMVPFEHVARAWALAPELTRDPAFGLHAAEISVGLHAHVLDYVTAHCRCPREMFEAVERYQRLLMSRADIRLQVEDGVATFAHLAEAIPEGRPAHMDDFVVAQWVLRVRARLPQGFPLRRVTFMHGAPADRDEHARIFQAPVVFGAACDSIVFDAALLDATLAGADGTLTGLLRRHADALLTCLPEEAATADALRRHLMDLSPATEVAIGRAARALGMSERSLQRRLCEEGTSFKDVLDGVRRDLALSYLGDPRQAIADVAFLVGFAETSTFSRAFRRWTRQSPAAWRRTHASLAPPARSLAPAGKTGASRGR